MRDLKSFLNNRRHRHNRKLRSSKIAEQIAMGSLNLHPRPKGVLLSALMERIGDDRVKPQSFDAILLPRDCVVSLQTPEEMTIYYPKMTLIDIKTTSRLEIGPDFAGFFFSLSENEIASAEVLGPKFLFVLFNLITHDRLFLTLPQLRSRMQSIHTSYSVQLKRRI